MAEDELPLDSKLNGRGDVGERAGVCRPALLINCGLWYRKWEELLSPSARKPRSGSSDKELRTEAEYLGDPETHFWKGESRPPKLLGAAGTP